MSDEARDLSEVVCDGCGTATPAQGAYCLWCGEALIDASPADGPAPVVFRGGHPVFATNDPDVSGGNVATAVRRMFTASRESLVEQPSVAIAAPYLNPDGFSMIHESVEPFERVRLLLGAEPDRADVRSHGHDTDAVSQALVSHDGWLSAERDLLGFTLNDETRARHLLSWLAAQRQDGAARVEVRRLTDRFLHGKAFIVDHPTHSAVLAGSSNLTAAGLTRNAELNIGYPGNENCELVKAWFDQLWGQAEPYDLAGVYAARWEPYEPLTVFEKMLLACYGKIEAAPEDLTAPQDLPLTVFQSEGVSRLLRFLEDFGGALLADEPGLGKTYMSGRVAIHYASRGQKVLILAPAAVRDSVWKGWLDRHNVSRRVQVMSYTEAAQRYRELVDEDGIADPDDLDREFGDYQLVIADEAHHLRNSNSLQNEAITEVVTAGLRKDMLLVTATPVNNSLKDLENLLGLCLVTDDALAHRSIPSWSKMVREAVRREASGAPLPEGVLFDLLDEMTVRRSRQFILEHPEAEGHTIQNAAGRDVQVKFPEVVLKPRTEWDLGAREPLLDRLMKHLKDETLKFARYAVDDYLPKDDGQRAFRVQRVGLLRFAILKRLESSPWAITRTLAKFADNYEWFLNDIRENGRVLTVSEMHEVRKAAAASGIVADDDDPAVLFDDAPESNGERTGRPTVGFRIDDLVSDAQADLRIIRALLREAEKVSGPAGDTYQGSGENDEKIVRLLSRLREIAQNAGTENDARKVLIFTEYADTATYVHQSIRHAIDAADEDDPLLEYRDRVAPAVQGSSDDAHTRGRIVAAFDPDAAERSSNVDRYDLLVSTDVLAEGVNLHRAGKVINYDLPWNPMRVVQRHGRVDRIGAAHETVEIDVFAPAGKIDDLIELMRRLEQKLASAHATIGVPETIRGMPGGGQGQLFTDKEGGGFEIALALLEGDDHLLRQRGRDSISQSESYRMMITQLEDPRATESLPAAIGSGFVSSRVREPVFVFCAQTGSEDTLRTHMVAVNADSATWAPQDRFATSTLECLRIAEPVRNDRSLPAETYPAVYDAWQACRSQIVAESEQALREAAVAAGQLPKPMRDALSVLNNQASLNPRRTEALRAAFRVAPSKNVEKRVRELLRRCRAADETNDRTAQRLSVLADRVGLTTQARRASKPHRFGDDDVRLVAWMAVTPSSGNGLQ